MTFIRSEALLESDAPLNGTFIALLIAGQTGQPMDTNRSFADIHLWWAGSQYLELLVLNLYVGILPLTADHDWKSALSPSPYTRFGLEEAGSWNLCW